MACILTTETFTAFESAGELGIKPGWQAEASKPTGFVGVPPPGSEIKFHVGYDSSAGVFTAEDDPEINRGEMFTTMNGCNQGPQGCEYRAHTFSRATIPGDRGVLQDAYEKTACTWGARDMPSWGCTFPLGLSATSFAQSGNQFCCISGTVNYDELNGGLILTEIDDTRALWIGRGAGVQCPNGGAVCRLTLDTILDRIVLDISGPGVGSIFQGSWSYLYNQNSCTPANAPLGLYTNQDPNFIPAGSPCGAAYFELNVFGCL